MRPFTRRPRRARSRGKDRDQLLELSLSGFAAPLRPVERFVPTAPDFLVEDVRLEAAAARCVVLPAPRDFDAVPEAAPFADEAFAPPRPAERVVDALEDDERADDRDPSDFAPVDFAEDDRAPVDRPPADFVAVAFVPLDLSPVDFAADRVVARVVAPDFAAEVPVVFLPVFAAPVDFALLLAPPLADFAAVFLVEAEPAFAAPDFVVDLLCVLPLDAPVLALLLLVLVDAEPLAPSPAPPPAVPAFCLVFDLSSVGIAASFWALAWQPSRLLKPTSLYQVGSELR